MSDQCNTLCPTTVQANADAAIESAVVAHKADPFAHPELKQVRQVVTSTGVVYDPANGPQVRTAIDTIVGCAVSDHKADGQAHPELPQVRKVIADAGITYNPADATQLSSAISTMIGAVEAPDATETLKGVVRLANNAEAQAGALYTVAVHPAGLKATIDGLINGAPASLNTLGELAAAVGNDAAFSDTMSTALNLKAPLASPALTGAPTAPTPAAEDVSTRLATTAFVKQSVDSSVNNLVNGAPAALNTLGELAAAIGNDAAFSSTVSTALGQKAPLASPALTGAPTAPTPAAEDVSTRLATTAFVKQSVDTGVSRLINGAPGALDTLEELAAALGNDANYAATITNALALKAPLASPALTGIPTAPTPVIGDESTTLATTAFVKAVVRSITQQFSMPVGVECWFAGTTPPTDWLVENGAILSRAAYPSLWAFVQSSGMMVTDTLWSSTLANRSKFSSGDGSTTFRLPDLTTDGLFIRAQSGSASNFGRRQEDEFKQHKHSVTQVINGVGDLQMSVQPGVAAFWDRVNPTGGDETRPKNAGRLPIIKAR